MMSSHNYDMFSYDLNATTKLLQNLTLPHMPWHPHISMFRLWFAIKDYSEVLSIRFLAMLHIRVALGVSHRLRCVVRGLSLENQNADMDGHQV